jgi:uncharacterized protein (DUF1697 family)
MTTYIALLRAINVGGHKQIKMTDLREMLTRLGFAGAQSLLQSGNLVFRSDARTASELESLLEAEAKSCLDLDADFFVRTAKEWQAVIANNPFREEGERDPGHLLVTFLKRAAKVKDVEALQAAITGQEIVRPGRMHVYIVYPAGIGRSRLTNAMLESKLGSRGTARNWNTVLKLAALTAAPQR